MVGNNCKNSSYSEICPKVPIQRLKAATPKDGQYVTGDSQTVLTASKRKF